MNQLRARTLCFLLLVRVTRGFTSARDFLYCCFKAGVESNRYHDRKCLLLPVHAGTTGKLCYSSTTRHQRRLSRGIGRRRVGASKASAESNSNKLVRPWGIARVAIGNKNLRAQ